MATSSKGLFGSSLARKYWMALSGLFLILFLVGHLLGNLQLFKTGEEGRLAFNAYGHFMTTFPLVKILSYLTYLSILLHAIDGIVLARQNKAARPISYAKENAKANASWASRSMALLGLITLFFIIVHMKSFWYEMHFGVIGNDTAGNKDLWTITVSAFEQWWYTAFYVVAMISLGFHLSHGAQSAFQTLGLNHPKYTPMIKKVMGALAWGITLLFACIPVYLYFVQPLQNL
jgi:succinate dehydrogenase / fumarate reductase cytochrome b subunit